MAEKPKLTQKEKADLYDNWLAYVNGRGWTEVMAEPQKIKEKLDKLNKEIESHKGTGIMLSQENQILKGHVIALTKKNEELRDNTAQLHKDLKQSMDHVNRILPIAEKNQKKLEKIKETATNEILSVENTLKHPDWILDDGELEGRKRTAELILEILKK